jgi:hypothetical protein
MIHKDLLSQTCAIALSSVCFAINAAAQSIGDWDGDGLVEYEDSAGLNSCLLGAAGGGPSCLNAFDFDGDGTVSLDDALRFADLAQPPAGTCTRYVGDRFLSKGFNGYIGYYGAPQGLIYGVDVLFPDTLPFNPTLCAEDAPGVDLATQSTLLCDIRYEFDDPIVPDPPGFRHELWWGQAGITRSRHFATNHELFSPSDVEAKHPYRETFDANRTPLRLLGPEFVVTVPNDRPLAIRIRRVSNTSTVIRTIFAWVDDFGTPTSQFFDTDLPSIALSNSANALLIASETEHIESRAADLNQQLDFISTLWAPGDVFSFQPYDLTSAVILAVKPEWIIVSQPFSSSSGTPDSFTVTELRP